MIHSQCCLRLVTRIGMSTAFLVLLLSGIAASDAGERRYHCEVTSHGAWADDGRLQLDRVSNHERARFTVSRVTGEVTGDNLYFDNLTQPKLVARGDPSNTFIATASRELSGGGLLLETLVVREYAKSPEKPFILVSSLGFVSAGVCR